jgi:DNA-nicking Smr family endonuclease
MKETDGTREILRYVERHGVRDKDEASARRRRLPVKKNIERGRKGAFRKTIDLHGMVSDGAELALAEAFDECAKHGIKELLVVHGWGMHSDPREGGVLKKLVRDSLEFRYAARVRSFGPALVRDGGEGATLVRLY